MTTLLCHLIGYGILVPCYFVTDLSIIILEKIQDLINYVDCFITEVSK